MASILTFLNVVPSYLSTSAEDAADVAWQVTASLSLLTAAPGTDAGLAVGQSEPQEPPMWLSQPCLAHSPLFPGSSPFFLPSTFPHFWEAA